MDGLDCVWKVIIKLLFEAYLGHPANIVDPEHLVHKWLILIHTVVMQLMLHVYFMIWLIQSNLS